MKRVKSGGGGLDLTSKQRIKAPPPVLTTMMTIFGGKLNLSIIKSNFLQDSITSEMQR